MVDVVADRTIGATTKAVLKGLIAFNRSKVANRRYKRISASLRDGEAIVGGIVGECWMTVLFIQMFWIDEKFRGMGNGEKLIAQIEEQARHYGAVQAYVDSMSFQAPGFYRKCGYAEFGQIGGYPEGVTRHWLTKVLAGAPAGEGAT